LRVIRTCTEITRKDRYVETKLAYL
jgi:hypothetical protein